MKKKLLSCILALSMVLSMVSFAVVAEETTEAVAEPTPKYEMEIGFLTTIGLLDKDFSWNANVTKAEVAKYIATAMHPEIDFIDTLANGQAFNDVYAAHSYYSYIRACKDLGIVKGDFENNFYPDNQVTAIEVMTMMVNALGYTPYAEAFGGYPTGFYQVASSTGISKGVNIASSEPATGEVVAKIIYNSLFADIVMMGAISNGSIEIEVNRGKNILSERLGIYEYDAIVVDNGIGSIYENSINDFEKAVIQDTKTNKTITAYANGTDVRNYLGYRVKAFVRNNPDTGRNEFVYVAPHASYEAITLNARYIFNVTRDYIEYDEDINTSDYEKYSLGGITPIIIVNGKRVTSIQGQTEEPLLKQVMAKDGFVTLIENDGDAAYDVINILSFNYESGIYTADARNIVVDSVVTTDEEHSISCAYNPSQSLDLSEEVANYSFAMSDDIGGIKKVKSGMIVSVAECPDLVDGKPYYFLVVRKDEVESVVSGRADDIIILEDGKEYELSTSLKANFVNYLPMGKKATLSLDATGKVAYAESEAGSAKNYAYLLRAVKRQYAGRDSIIVKVFGKDGKMQEFRLADKCKIDGVWYDNANNQLAAINTRNNASAKMEGDVTTGRPVILDINSSDLITRIDTDNPNTDLGYSSSSTYVNATPIVKSEFYSSQQPIPYSEEDEASFDSLKAGFRSPRATAFFNGTTKTMEGKWFITTKTLVINTGEIDTYAGTPAEYSTYSVAYGNGADKYHKAPAQSIVQIQSNEGTEEDYAILKAADVKTGVYYDIQGYDIDPDTGVAGLAVIRGRVVQTTPGSNANLSVYSRKTLVYDEKLEKSVDKLYFYGMDGKEASFLYDPEKLSEAYVTLVDQHLKKGDICRVMKDEDGFISYIDRMQSIESVVSKDTYTSWNNIDLSDGIADASGSTYHLSYSNGTYVLGYANKINGNIVEMVSSGINTKLSDLSADLNIIPANRKFFIDFLKLKPLVITFNGSDMKAETGTMNDIVTVKEVTDNNGNIDVDKASVILFRHNRFVPNTIIVLNGLNTYVNN